MRYFVTVDDTEIPVDVTVQPDGGYRVIADGREIQADVVALDDALSVRIGDRVIDLTVQGQLPDLAIVAGEHRANVKVESERLRAAAAAESRALPGDNAVLCPMPGRIVSVLVEQGQQVQAGQALVVVEAMKMENELRAAKAATVAKVHVAAGDRVEGGALLVELQ